MKNTKGALADLAVLKKALSHIPAVWDGRECIEEMKARDYHWRQMEWIGFYGQMLAEDLLRELMQVPGKRYNNVLFDVSGNINWDIKVHPTTTASSILNDIEATEHSIKENGVHGLVMIAVNVEYDEDGQFKRWHDALKGGKSDYEKERIKRGAPSRRRKVRAKVEEINFVLLTAENIGQLGTAQDGWRNSNGVARRPKYKITKAQMPLLVTERMPI